MQEYYSILGVHPGASSAEIQKAFRDRIKLCHPDKSSGTDQAETARRLIEAYNRLRENVAGQSRSPGRRPGSSAQEGATTRDAYYTARARQYGGPHKAGEKIFRSVFDEDIFASVERFRKSTSGSPYTSHFKTGSPHAGGYQDQAAREESYRVEPDSEPRDPVAGASSSARSAYHVAEDFLRNVVKKYKKQVHRPRKQWARDYVRDLNLVQIKFRDVASGYPSIYTASMKRLRQIQELSEEVKKIMHG